MALTVGDREVRPLTAGEVMRMVDAGIVGEDEHVELLHGALTVVSPKSARHGAVIARLVRWLHVSDREGRFEVLTEHPLVVPDETSLPEPDVAVVGRRADVTRHPTTALLVIEVALTSLRTDIGIKSELYASAGVPEYWVVDVPSRRLHVFSAPRDGRYTASTIVEPPAPLGPTAVEVTPLQLRSLFDGL